MRPSITHHTPTQQAINNHTRILSGNIEFGVSNTDQSKNIRGWHANGIVTPATANTIFAVPISLGYIPTHWYVEDISAAARVYRATTPWTLTDAYFACDTASVTVSIFIY
jgi:hypothetical protein